MLNFSIIQKSQLEGLHRLDPEYYQPEYLRIVSTLLKIKNISLGSVAQRITQGPNPIFIESGKISLNGRNIKNLRVIEDDSNYVSEQEFENYKNFKIKQDDILITLKGLGSIGKTGYVFQKIEAIFSRDIGLIRLNNPDLSKFIYAFLLSKYGSKQIERSSTGGTGQLTLAIIALKQIIIPQFKDENIKRIGLSIVDSEKAYEQSNMFYEQAEDLLLEELGLSSFAKAMEDEKDLSWIVNLSDIRSAKRVDADYLQPKYQKLISKIELKGIKKLEDFIQDYSTGFPFKSENYQEDGIPLIRINNIKRGFIDLTDTAYLSGNDYLLSPKDIAKPGDIVLSMSGTIGMSAVIPSDVVKCSINQRILRFTPKDIDPDLLVLILNSIIGNYQLERIGTGGVQININYRDIQNILIPVLPMEIQQKIIDLVRESHEARKKSKELLEEAKRKVEEMIEKDDGNSV